MPDRGPATEFGGKVIKRHGVQPPPHVPTPSERLSLLYRTADESGIPDVDAGDAFNGTLPGPEQLAIRAAEGVFAKGEEWERIQSEATSEIEALRNA
jgi:hypothetical protein